MRPVVLIDVNLWRGCEGWKGYRVTFEGDVAVRVESAFSRWRGEKGSIVHRKIWATGNPPIPAAVRAIRAALDARRLSKLDHGTADALR